MGLEVLELASIVSDNPVCGESEGHFTHSKNHTRIFRTKGFLQILDGFSLNKMYFFY